MQVVEIRQPERRAKCSPNKAFAVAPLQTSISGSSALDFQSANPEARSSSSNTVLTPLLLTCCRSMVQLGCKDDIESCLGESIWSASLRCFDKRYLRELTVIRSTLALYTCSTEALDCCGSIRVS